MSTALIWNHRFDSTREFPEWDAPIRWLIGALKYRGWRVLRHPEFTCSWNLETSDQLRKADLVIYTHTTANHVYGYEGPQWFVKSTAPDQFHTTVDPLGYGPFSSITYEKPPFEGVSDADVSHYFAEKVPRWIDARTSKWGDGLFNPTGPPGEGYVLVLAQTLKDETVEAMWFGHYLSALVKVVNVIAQVEPRVVVKLHPWIDGTNGFTADGKPKAQESTTIRDHVKKTLEALSPRVEVYTGMSSVHGFIRDSRCVVLCNSSSGLDALLHRKPIISWGFPEYHWVTYDMRHLCELPKALSLDWFDERRAAQFIYWYTERYCIYDEESTKRRVEDLL